MAGRDRRLPLWIEEPGGPFRPWGAIWVSRSTGLVNFQLESQSPEAYAFGSEEEAVIAGRILAEAWQATPGAPEWLATAAEGRRGGKKRPR